MTEKFRKGHKALMHSSLRSSCAVLGTDVKNKYQLTALFQTSCATSITQLWPMLGKKVKDYKGSHILKKKKNFEKNIIVMIKT